MGLWLGKKNTFEKKSGLNRVLPSRPGHESTQRSTWFLRIPIFYLIRIGQAIKSTHRADSSLITMVKTFFF